MLNTPELRLILAFGLLLSPSLASGAEIPIVNPSFEDDVVGGIGASLMKVPAGWASGGNVRVYQGAANFLNSPGPGTPTNPSNNIPDGVNVLQTSNATITQTLNSTFGEIPGTRYDLFVSVGDRFDTLWGGYSVRLRAGDFTFADVRPSFLTGTGPDSPSGGFVEVVASYTITGNDPQLGMPLDIWLSSFGINGQVSVFDAVRLERSPPKAKDEFGVYKDGLWFLDVDGDFGFSAGTEAFGWGSPGNVAVKGDWNGDGFHDLGVYSGGVWFIDLNGDRAFNPATDIKGWGAPGFIPITGDWNNDGKTDLGAIDPASMTWFLDLNGDFIFQPGSEIVGWGSPGDTPVVGDWDGDGDDDIGVFSGGIWFIDFTGNFAFDPSTDIRGWGVAGWTPIVGDWNGDGADELGVVDPSTMAWFRDVNGDFAFDPGTELVGWGSPGNTPLKGDWDSDGDEDIGVYADGAWFIDSNGDGSFSPAFDQRGWGQAGWTPIPGRWK